MDGNEFIKFLTEKFVTHLHMTKKEKVDVKAERKKISKATNNFSNSWFGVLPISLKLIRKKD